ncbi:hypothetical protein [Streptomyces sp. NPDC058326]|uniref:hypothetical protein n=1 Tax=Streptomyces sp. NPDC058326 TaxID=3346447 RepID=UPI0036E8D8E5
MRTRGTFRYAVAMVAVLSAATGCQRGDRQVCTLIGAESGVSVVYRPTDFAAGAHYRLCVDEACRELRTTGSPEPVGHFTVPLPEATGEQRTTVRLRVTDPASGRTVYDRTTEVTLRKSTPNGPKCDPTVWQAGLRADVREGLVPDVDRPARSSP